MGGTTAYLIGTLVALCAARFVLGYVLQRFEKLAGR